MRIQLESIIFITLSGIILVTQSDEKQQSISTFRATFAAAMKECSSIASVNLAQLIVLWNNPENMSDDEKCFLHCTLKHYQVMDNDDQFSIDGSKSFLELIPKSRFKTFFDKNLNECIEVDAEEPCEKAYVFINCFYKKSKQK